MTAGHNRPLEPNFKSAHDWHIYHVYNDPEFIEAAELIKQFRKRPNATPQDIEAMVHDVATYFVIRVGDVNLFLLPLYLENRKKPTAIGFDLATQRFTISFEPTTTKAELLDEWK